MKKTKIMGAALSAVMVGLLAVGCDSAVLNDIAKNMDPVKPGESEQETSPDMFNQGEGISLWYGEALNNKTSEKTTAIMKIEPLPEGTSTVIDGYIELGFIRDTGNIRSNTGLLGSYKLENDNTSMSIRWGGDYATESTMRMFDLIVKTEPKEALLTGVKGTSLEDYTITFVPVAIGKNALSEAELTKGFQKATAADMTNYILSLNENHTFVWGGEVNGFKIPNGTWEVTEKGDLILKVKYNGEDVVINRVAGVNLGDETDNWGRGSVAVEKSLWIAFDSADLKKIGYPEDTAKAFSNLPLLFSINTTTK